MRGLYSVTLIRTGSWVIVVSIKRLPQIHRLCNHCKCPPKLQNPFTFHFHGKTMTCVRCSIWAPSRTLSRPLWILVAREVIEMQCLLRAITAWDICSRIKGSLIEIRETILSFNKSIFRQVQYKTLNAFTYKNSPYNRKDDATSSLNAIKGNSIP